MTKLIRKTLILTAGVALIGVGLLLLILPGPGILLILAGIFVLSLEFEWANRLLVKLKSKWNNRKRKH